MELLNLRKALAYRTNWEKIDSGSEVQKCLLFPQVKHSIQVYLNEEKRIKEQV